MKRKSEVFLLSILILVLLMFAGYFLLAFYYKGGFSLNTWINGVYCTGKTVEEVNSELLSRMEAPIVMITDRDGTEYEISLADMGYQGDYLTVLEEYQEKQNPFFWVDNITVHRNHQLVPKISYNKELLKKAFLELNFIKKEQQKLTDYCLKWNAEKGYYIYDGLSKRIDIDKTFETFVTVIENGETHIDVAQLEYYYDIPLSKEQKELKRLWDKIEKFQNCDIIYDMSTEKVNLSPSVMSRFLKAEKGIPVVTQDNSFELDEDAVRKFVSDLAKSYDTYGKERQFATTRGDTVTVKGGTYGTTLNQNAEVEFLMENLLLSQVHTGIKKEHIPKYLKEANVRGKNDIGDTYIEIDMTNQKLYYYEKGELILETDVVTGNMKRKMGTPEGVNFVYNKQKNRVLRGPGYASPVKFWMPVKGGIGIHDANWRKEFGGDIYKTNGSHGCINTPTDKMTELYDRVEIGTPVIMFY